MIRTNVCVVCKLRDNRVSRFVWSNFYSLLLFLSLFPLETADTVDCATNSRKAIFLSLRDVTYYLTWHRLCSIMLLGVDPKAVNLYDGENKRWLTSERCLCEKMRLNPSSASLSWIRYFRRPRAGIIIQQLRAYNWIALISAYPRSFLSLLHSFLSD